MSSLAEELAEKHIPVVYSYTADAPARTMCLDEAQQYIKPVPRERDETYQHCLAAINEALEWAKEQALSMKYLSACSHAQEMADMIANAILAGKSEAKS